MTDLVHTLLAEAGIAFDAATEIPDGTGWVETVRRGEVTFLINHGSVPVSLTARGRDLLSGSPTAGMVLEPQGVAVIEHQAITPSAYVGPSSALREQPTCL
jgi:beta-galactosidase